jgi:hypothetical protein
VSKQLEILDLAITHDPSREHEPACKACGDRGYTTEPRPRRQRRTITGQLADVHGVGTQRVACRACLGAAGVEDTPTSAPIAGVGCGSAVIVSSADRGIAKERAWV